MHDLKVNDPIRDRHEVQNMSQLLQANLEDRHNYHLGTNNLEKQIHMF